MILVNFGISTSVQVILTLIKKGAKIMYKKFSALDGEQRLRLDNKTRDAAKVKFEMGALEHP